MINQEIFPGYQESVWVLYHTIGMVLKTLLKGIWEWDLESGEMIWSDEVRMLLGLDFYTGKPSRDIWMRSIMPGDRMRSQQLMEEAIAKRDRFTVECHVADSSGSIRTLITEGFPVCNVDGRVNRYMGITRDVTRYSDDGHVINARNLSCLIFFCRQPLCAIEREGTIITANKDFEDLFSSEFVSLKGLNIHTLFRHELKEKRNEAFDMVFNTGKALHFKEWFQGKENGKSNNKESFYQISAYPVYEEKGAIISLAIFVTNATRHDEAEQGRIQLDKQYKTLIAASPDSIIMTDLDGTISSISDIGLEIFGANSKSEVIGQPFSRIVSSSNLAIIDEIFDVALSEGLIQNREILLKKRNNMVYPAEISAALIQDYDGAPSSYMMIIRDITQRKIIESELFHAKRLISLGEMASGMAHEIW